MKPDDNPLTSVVVLLAEDNPADQCLARRAFEQTRIPCDLRIVADGEELLRYLKQEAPYDEPEKAPWPDLILLDLNMPKVDGREALAQIKAHPELALVPVVVLTTSEHEKDVMQSYQLGCSSFIVKPSSVPDLMKTFSHLSEYWFDTVILPPKGAHV